MKRLIHLFIGAWMAIGMGLAVLYVNLTGNGQVTQITGPDQKPQTLNNAPLTQRWSANISAAGAYTVTLSGAGPSMLTFSVPIPIPAP